MRLPLIAAAIAPLLIAAVQHPAAGSAERRAVLDALRPAIEAKFRVPIEFKVNQICVENGWAVVLAAPQTKDGRAAPWRNAMTKDEYDLGGDDVSAVLRLKGGRWNLVESDLGATDVWYEKLVPTSLLQGC